ncbi:hypothetical protein HYX10_05225 [Candidatus Woesearchaeota archaeon]|nr:hypothetical protein [Candidatus Woesearchaeota archaeon]
MKIEKVSILGILILLWLALSSVSYGLSANEYINEFNNSEEVCAVANYFNYWTPQSNLFNSDNHKLAVPVIYLCCDVNKECTSITFDLQNQEFLTDDHVAEVTDLDYIHKKIENGTISDEAYLLDSAFDVCSFFGIDKLQQEALNIGGEAAQEVRPLLNTRKSQIVKESLTAAKSIGIIKKLNPADLVVSATCYINQNSLKQAMEKLTECNGYLHNIKNRRVIAGQAKILRNCDSEAKNILAEYVDSDVSKIRCTANKFGNAVTGAIPYIKSIGKNPHSPDNELRIAENECELAQKAMSQLNQQDLHLDNPETTTILAKYRQRVQEKQRITEAGLTTSNENYQRVKKLPPSFLNLQLTNLFYEPNYNISNAKTLTAQAEKILVEGNNYLKEYRYNSAITAFEKVNELLVPAEEELKREQAVQRSFDKRWLVAVFIILLLFMLYKTRKR